MMTLLAADSTGNDRHRSISNMERLRWRHVAEVPVIIDYYTLYPNPETGEWETWRDRYEYDIQIIKTIKPFLP